MKNRKIASTTILIPLTFSLSGCAPDRGLDFSKSGESVEVSISTPEGMNPYDIDIIYRSKKCVDQRHSWSSGTRFEQDAYQNLKITPDRAGQGNVYKAHVPVDGGGYCEWRLSNFRFGIEYRSTEQFGQNVVMGRSASIQLKYDGNRLPVGGGNEQYVDGDLLIQRDYYPWVHERFNEGRRKSINLAGQGGLRTNFYAPQARKIHFQPIIHSGFVVFSTTDPELSPGPGPLFTYPDGSTQSEYLRYPDFKKLQRIREKLEGTVSTSEASTAFDSVRSRSN